MICKIFRSHYLRFNFINQFSFLRPYTNVNNTSYNYRQLIEDDFSNVISKIPTDIIKYVKSQNQELNYIMEYSFKNTGKMIRPQIIILLASILNDTFIDTNEKQNSKILINDNQYKIALIAEMIHTASLIHDDLIDNSDTRRGLPSTVTNFNAQKAILGGDYILSKASQLLASIENTEVVSLISNLIQDLIKGEIMQLGSYDDIGEKFDHYFTKTYRKTASLFANCCKSIALLDDNWYKGYDRDVIEASFEFGSNSGIAFQLIDDILDFVSTNEQLGKPGGGNDMKLGLATGPVLFAAESFPEVNEMILRKLSQPGDFEKMMEYIAKSEGIEKTREKALVFYETSLVVLSNFPDTHFKTMLLSTMHKMFHRTK